MTYKVERLRQATDDLDALFDFLVESYLHFGDSLSSAVDRATTRVERVKKDMRALGRAPHQGALLPHLARGLCSVTKERAIFYFSVDDEARVVRVLAVFFGSQDHQRGMLRTLLRE